MRQQRLCNGLAAVAVVATLQSMAVADQAISGTVYNQQQRSVAGVVLRWVGPSDVVTEVVSDAAGEYSVGLPSVTAVAEDSPRPHVSELLPNYPNPFNPGTTIPFLVGQADGEATLSIFDALGRRVRLYASVGRSPGHHEIYWDGRDESGDPVAAGVYIYRLETSRTRLHRKMVRVDGGGWPGGTRAQVATGTLTSVSGNPGPGQRATLPGKRSKVSGDAAGLQGRYTVELSSERILDRVEAVEIAGRQVIDFVVDERFLWTRRAAMPTPRQELTASAWDNRIWVFGGLDAGARSLDVAEEYDPQTDSWRRVRSLPVPLDHLAASTVGDRIYVVGGYTRGELGVEISRRTLEYDPATDTWARRADMPIARGAHGLAVLGSRVYVVGGLSPTGEDGSRVLIYATESDTWSVGAALPVSSEHLAVTAVDGRAFAISGRFGVGRSEVQIYDPTTDSWELGVPIPTPRSGILALSQFGMIYVFGGELPGVFAENEVYSATEDRWRQAPPMPTARHGLAGAQVDGKFYVIGGGLVAGLDPADVVEEYVP